MTFQIQCSDEHFRLVVISDSGEDDYNDAVQFCSLSSVVGPDGRVYGAYLNAAEKDLDELEKLEERFDKNPGLVIVMPEPEYISMIAKTIKVYDVTDWPAIKEVAGAKITLIMTTFPEIEEEEEGEEDETVIDVEPIR